MRSLLVGVGGCARLMLAAAMVSGTGHLLLPSRMKLCGGSCGLASRGEEEVPKPGLHPSAKVHVAASKDPSVLAPCSLCGETVENAKQPAVIEI